MRLWSLHPMHLDRQGLTGAWREALLAQAVLAGRTRGYRSHPQLLRFREQPDPSWTIGAYLQVLADEATRRGYRFDRSRIDHPAPVMDPKRPMTDPIPVTDGQLIHEWHHLLAKLAHRSPELAEEQASLAPSVHPLFTVVSGPVADWERADR